VGGGTVIVARHSTAEPELFAGYAYSYPHKSSYRPLSPAVPLADAWRHEDTSRLSLYVHIPFCEMRCGFCNLFTQSQPADELVAEYLAALSRQMDVVRSTVPDATFAQAAIGGGTPTFLEAGQLENLFGCLERFAGRRILAMPTSIETSPATATLERLRVLADFGVRRVSLGVQSFEQLETRRIGRPQTSLEACRAIERIRSLGFPVLNVDLIYGGAAQTGASWRASLREAVRFRPEELYLYPLYVRPETGLANTGASAAQWRSDLYREACDLLRAEGYRQSSLRSFQLPGPAQASDYGCQRDGMIGLGCGARSYTRALHYAQRFATTQAGIRAIVRDWIAQTDDDFARATHGFHLSDDEQRRRFLILSVLQAEGMAIEEFQERFPECDVDACPGLAELVERGWLTRTADRYVPTPAGIEHSDFLGPLLYSESVLRRLREFTRLPAERDDG
jgi:oxygen-independent coproporphyrinogen III oxidase